MPEEAIQLSWEVIIEVMYTRFMHMGKEPGEQLCKDLLLTAQMTNFHTFVRTVCTYCTWF
jgi:hypothetical protein